MLKTVEWTCVHYTLHRSQENGEEFVRLLGDQVAANSAANRLADSVLEIHVFAPPTVYPVASMETAECG